MFAACRVFCTLLVSLAFIYSCWVVIAIYNLADWLPWSNSPTTSLFCSLQLVLRDPPLLAINAVTLHFTVLLGYNFVLHLHLRSYNLQCASRILFTNASILILTVKSQQNVKCSLLRWYWMPESYNLIWFQHCTIWMYRDTNSCYKPVFFQRFSIFGN